MKRLWFAILVFTLAVSAAAESQKPANTFEGKVASVAVFKNGYGFFRVDGEAAPVDGVVEIAPLPAAVLGTWWFYSHDKSVVIESATASEREADSVRAVRSLGELLAANPDREVIVETDKRNYSGRLLAVGGQAGSPPPQTRPLSMVAVPGFDGVLGRRDIILKTDDGVISIRAQDIRTVQIEGAGTDFHEKKKETCVSLHLKGVGKSASIGYEFLQKGIRWIPSYRVELVDDRKASLVLQAEVINDIHDLDGATLQLVVGVPNFMYADLISPLACLAEVPRLSAFFQEGSRRGDTQLFSNAMISQTAAPYEEARWGPRAGSGAPEVESAFVVPDLITSKSVSDLFYYDVKDFTLKKGRRACAYILHARCPYEHIYKWKPGNQETPRPVEHYIRLENKSGKPLTSGPAMLLSKGKVLSQDVLEYTPTGGTADVKVTAAVDIKTSRKEEETARKHNALVAYGRRYDQVNARGTLTLKNYKAETVRIVVTRNLEGAVSETSEGAVVTRDTSNLKSVNPHSVITWEFDLSPNQEKELKYSYSTYVKG